MVTRSYAASFAKRILFIRTASWFQQRIRKALPPRDFFSRIAEVVTFLGGGDAADTPFSRLPPNIRRSVKDYGMCYVAAPARRGISTRSTRSRASPISIHGLETAS